jgi:hypothetical protein
MRHHPLTGAESERREVAMCGTNSLAAGLKWKSRFAACLIHRTAPPKRLSKVTLPATAKLFPDAKNDFSIMIMSGPCCDVFVPREK